VAMPRLQVPSEALVDATSPLEVAMREPGVPSPAHNLASTLLGRHRRRNPSLIKIRCMETNRVTLPVLKLKPVTPAGHDRRPPRRGTCLRGSDNLSLRRGELEHLELVRIGNYMNAREVGTYLREIRAVVRSLHQGLRPHRIDHQRMQVETAREEPFVANSPVHRNW